LRANVELEGHHLTFSQATLWKQGEEIRRIRRRKDMEQEKASGDLTWAHWPSVSEATVTFAGTVMFLGSNFVLHVEFEELTHGTAQFSVK